MKDVEFKRQFMIAYHNIFGPPEELNPLQLLGTVPKRAALETIAYLLLRLTNIRKDDNEFHRSNLAGWMMKLEEVEKQVIFKFIDHEKIFSKPGFTFTDTRACLQLIQFLAIAAEEDDRELTEKDWVSLLGGLLYCNHLELSRQKHVFYWDGKGGTEDYLERILPLKISSIELDRRKNYQLQLMKVYYFFNFCETDKEYKEYLARFLNEKGLATYSQYLLSVIDPYLTMITHKEMSCILQVEPDNYNTIAFLDTFLINDREIRDNSDYLDLRSFPIFRGGDGRYTFLYNNFFIDKLYQGFLFDFIKALNSSSLPSIDYSKLKTDMGNRFSEKVLLYTIMERCFPIKSYKKLRGDELKTFLKLGEPDYYLRSGNRIFLFEFKDYTISADIKHDGNGKGVKRKLVARLGGSLTQLAQSLVKIFDKTYQNLTIDQFNPGNILVYPILVHTDVSLEADGVNYVLKPALQTLTEEKMLPGHQIKELVLINLDTFIAFQDLFRKGQIKLQHVIDEYLRYVKRDSVSNQLYPFDEFFKHYLANKKFNLLTPPDDFDRILKALKVYL